MRKEKEILNIKNFLTYEEYFNLKSVVNDLQWGFYGRSSSAMAEWHLNHPIYGGNTKALKNFNELHPQLRFVLNKLSKDYNCLIHPYDIYFNAYRFGNEMDIHTDKCTRPGFNRTIIIYLTDDWLPQWHGETVFYDDKTEDVIKSVLPYPNSAVIFDSRIPHSSVPISKFCVEKRIILVYQCEIEYL